MALPRLLAGPILRRTDARAVNIWVATTGSVNVRATVFRFADGPGSAPVAIASAPARSARLGKSLSVHLVTVVPDDGFPTDELLAYDVTLRGRDEASEGDGLGSLGLLQGPTALSYGDLPFPTFYIREQAPALKVMHGSCRLLHGAGEDALLAADEIIARRPLEVAERPSAIFLTGDQIYADDVAAAMVGHIRRLATELVGTDDETSVPQIPSLAEIPVDGRGDLVRERARFTSEKPQNHLMSFGEFAAMYVTAWNEAVWPASWPSADEALTRGDGSRVARARARWKYESQRKHLGSARAALPSVRRVFANTPIYMSFDDHDTTDDWNLTRAWRDDVRQSPTGRRVVANALASFWAFQGWGNDPESFDEAFIDTLTGFLSEDEAFDGDAFDSLLWSFDRWSYSAPTRPPTIVLDTRTQRDYDSGEGGARLLGANARRRVTDLVGRSGYRVEHPLIIVSAVPVFGFELQERRQKYLVDKLGPYGIDFEAWHSNLRGLVDFMQLLVEEIDPSSCILLSGDVHYGVNARASFMIEGKTLLFTQLVSSGQKHASAAARSTLNSLGRLLKTKHERLGWDEPPECKRKGKLADRIMLRAVNTDEWAADSPVFLAPRDVKVLGIGQPPDFRECRIYVRPEGRNSSILVGENNMGLISLEGREITHRLLARGKGRTREHVATINIELQDLV